MRIHSLLTRNTTALTALLWSPPITRKRPDRTGFRCTPQTWRPDGYSRCLTPPDRPSVRASCPRDKSENIFQNFLWLGWNTLSVKGYSVGKKIGQVIGLFDMNDGFTEFRYLYFWPLLKTIYMCRPEMRGACPHNDNNIFETTFFFYFFFFFFFFFWGGGGMF